MQCRKYEANGMETYFTAELTKDEVSESERAYQP